MCTAPGPHIWGYCCQDLDSLATAVTVPTRCHFLVQLDSLVLSRKRRHISTPIDTPIDADRHPTNEGHSMDISDCLVMGRKCTAVQGFQPLAFYSPCMHYASWSSACCWHAKQQLRPYISSYTDRFQHDVRREFVSSRDFPVNEGIMYLPTLIRGGYENVDLILVRFSTNYRNSSCPRRETHRVHRR